MTRLVLRRTGSSLLLKSHDAGRDDKPQKKAGDAYSHPHVVGKATVTDEHSTGPQDASTMQFAGTNYSTTGKQGKSFHDETPVREFESEGDGHRVWMDHHARVHADSKDEVPHLRKKAEAHAADQGGEPAPGEEDTASGGADASGGEDRPDKVDKAAVLEAALGKSGSNPMLLPAKDVQAKMAAIADKVKPLGFEVSETKGVDKAGNGSITLTNEAGQRIVILAQRDGDRAKVSVALLDAEPKPEGERKDLFKTIREAAGRLLLGRGK
ncbi:MAG: hypothetical protein ACJ75S_07080 [Solirubrobacterales bacterium]|jgi:hypothetical protein